jgi:hypothetical protein
MHIYSDDVSVNVKNEYKIQIIHESPMYTGSRASKVGKLKDGLKMNHHGFFEKKAHKIE